MVIIAKHIDTFNNRFYVDYVICRRLKTTAKVKQKCFNSMKDAQDFRTKLYCSNVFNQYV